MENSSMTFQYVYHSGFIAETEKNVFVFDYYQGSVNLKEKNIYVFSSHVHPDHFNPLIFEWQKERTNIQYILSSDIEGNKSLPLNRDNITFLSPYEEIYVNDLKIRAYNSTDEGVSFLIESDGTCIFHAGDLNWWYWQGDPQEDIEKAEKMYKDEIQRIKGERIDVAFFPVDPRLEQFYSLGAEYFIQEITPQILVPMHFGDEYLIPIKFADKMKGCSTQIVQITHRGQEFSLL